MAAKRRVNVTKVPGRAPTVPAPERGREEAVVTGQGPAVGSVVIGQMVSGSTASVPLVNFPGNTQGPIRARTSVPMDAGLVDRAVATSQGVVLAFENGDPHLPIVTGLIWTGYAPTPFQELLVSPRGASTAPPASPVRDRLEARLDGERVILEGKREIVLKCGEASIALRSDGKIVLRGAYIETYAKGLNRIKGASVKIN